MRLMATGGVGEADIRGTPHHVYRGHRPVCMYIWTASSLDRELFRKGGIAGAIVGVSIGGNDGGGGGHLFDTQII